MPNSFEVTCSAPPSMFAYPKLEEKKEGNIISYSMESTTINLMSNSVEYHHIYFI